jgi:uncharacterized membrane protein YeaQ/YmgE (transglycosylase-associated protein family)
VSRNKKLLLVAAMVLSCIDVFLIFFANQKAVNLINWERIGVGFFLQLIVIGIFAGWLAWPLTDTPQSDELNVSYRGIFPMTLVGVVGVMTAFSLHLMYTAIACPNQKIPTSRGHPVCLKKSVQVAQSF